MRMQSLALTLAFGLLCAPAAFSAEEPSPDHVKLMKELGSLNGKIRKGEDVEASAKSLAEAGKKVEAFWGPRSPVGKKSAQDLIAGAEQMGKAAAANSTEGIMAAAKSVGGSCRNCHDEHREKVSENVYKIK